MVSLKLVLREPMVLFTFKLLVSWSLPLSVVLFTTPLLLIIILELDNQVFRVKTESLMLLEDSTSVYLTG